MERVTGEGDPEGECPRAIGELVTACDELGEPMLDCLQQATCEDDAVVCIEPCVAEMLNAQRRTTQ
jgi:hypothetical protein